MNPYEIAQACMDATAFTAPEDTAMQRTKLALVIDKALTKARDAALEEAARECDRYSQERLCHGAMSAKACRDLVRALKSEAP